MTMEQTSRSDLSKTQKLACVTDDDIRAYNDYCALHLDRATQAKPAATIAELRRGFSRTRTDLRAIAA